MLELDKDRFAQLLREVPEKDALFPEPQYSPYIQSLIDRLKEEESLDLAAIDWSAFEMADVTIPFFQDNANDTKEPDQGACRKDTNGSDLSVPTTRLLLRWQDVRLRI